MENLIERDQRTIEVMVRLYCRHRLNLETIPQEYQDVINYACRRLEHCRFGVDKPACKDCPHHCYKPEMRDKVRAIMRWAGPRMFFYEPRAALRHVLQQVRMRMKRLLASR